MHERAGADGDGNHRLTLKIEGLSIVIVAGAVAAAEAAAVDFTLEFPEERIDHVIDITRPDGSLVYTIEGYVGPVTYHNVVPIEGPGAYTWQCRIHPQMKAVVTAQ